MESNVKVTFWLNKTKKNSLNLTPVYMRVAYDYAHFTLSTGIQVRVQDWDKKSMRIRGTTQKVYVNNSQMDSLKMKVLQIVNQLTVLGKPFNINTIKKTLEGNETNQITLMRICDEQIAEMQKLRGKDYAPTTIIKYKNTGLRLRQFLKHKFENSTTICYKHYQRLTRMIHNAMHKGYLDKYPFENYKIRMPKKKIEYLTQEEINRIEQKELKVERLGVMRGKNGQTDHLAPV